MKAGSRRKNHKLRVIMVIVLIISLISLIVTLIYAKRANEQVHSLSFDWSIDDPDNEEIYIFATSGTPWSEKDAIGDQYDFRLVNNSRHAISNWSMVAYIPTGCDIDSSWNGLWAINQNKLIYEPADYNMYAAAGEQRTFGLVMYAPYVCDMDEITLEYTEAKKATAYPMFWISFLAWMTALLALIVEGAISYRVGKYEKTHSAYKELVSESLRTIANIIDTKDEYTKGHSLRVAIYSRMIAERMGMSEYEQERSYYIGLLHDIGKVGIPVSILTKPGRLTTEEFEIIKRHPSVGAQIMKDFSSIPGVINGIKYHHERYDGNGYNEGLKGEDIPLEGRIIAVADAYDAMSSRRCYRNSLSYDFIMDELKRNSGIQFDPEILKYMIAMVEEGYAPVSEAEMEDYEI